VIALALAVGMVLSDSSVVILALPDILDQFNVAIDDVSWVLTIFNLVLAIVAVPAALLARRWAPGLVCSVGLVVFAAASLACALAPSFAFLLGGRAVQAVGGAAAVCSALELLPARVGSERRAAAIWALAGALGAAAGPAIGGALTEAISWKAIFIVQVPLALGALIFIPRGDAPIADRQRAGRPHIGANLALGLLSAALTAALFLIVLLLINGWGHSPIEAAAIVTVMPIAAAVTYFLPFPRPPSPVPAVCGAVLIGGGLIACALLPGADWWWLVLPQVAIGAGLALAVGSLTQDALEGRSAIAIHGGWTIASRHAGVCIGLLILTPIFTSDLLSQQDAAEASGTRIILDSNLSFTGKLDLGSALVDQIQAGAVTKPPNLAPAFDEAIKGGSDPTEIRALEAKITDEVERAVTHAFSRSFLIAGLLGLLAIVPLARRVSL
jgi:MFS family permease